MAGIMSIFKPRVQGYGGKLLVYCFDDDTYDELEEEIADLVQHGEWLKLEAELATLSACLIFELSLDSLFQIEHH